MTTDTDHDDDRPAFARRIRREREARGWSVRDAVRAMSAHSKSALSSEESLQRNWKRWEAGAVEPDGFNKPLIAQTFGTVTAALFPSERARRSKTDLVAATGMETLEILARMRASDVSSATLDALRFTAEHLCSEYPHLASAELRLEGQQWLRRITDLLDSRLTLAQHQEVLTLAGTFALLVGCVEYDMGDTGSAEATRQAARSLGEEAGNAEVVGWAHEMQAWYTLTQGDYRGTIAASNAGQAAAPRLGVSVQLAAQKAKAWARLGDRRQVEVALDQGRALLEALPYPDNLDHHFVVDPSKFDFYAMDCYRVLGEDRLARAYAEEVLRAGTTFDGVERSPMRNAEARVTLGVLAAREGDVEAAVHHGERALAGDRQSLPTLVMCSRELGSVLRQRCSAAPQTATYLDRLASLTPTTSQPSIA